MSLKCLMNGLEVNYPCSPTCALFGDCCTAFEAQKKSRVVTNANHIRSMTDEGLASDILDRNFCGRRTTEDCRNAHGICTKCAMDWLKQPYKEEV